MTFEEMKEELYKREEEAMNDRDTADDDEYLDGVFDGLHEAAKLVSITEPVVRCKNCENWDKSWFATTGSIDHFCSMMDTFTGPDEFCSRAERRTDE